MSRNHSMTVVQSNGSSQTASRAGQWASEDHRTNKTPDIPQVITGSGDASTVSGMSDSIDLKASHTLEANHFPSGLRAAHLNIRSLCGHYAELCTLLKNKPLDILAVSETWLDETVSDEEVAINGYSLVRNDRNRTGGGVMIYVRDNIMYTVNRHPTTKLEAISIHIQTGEGPEVVLTNIYRSPSQCFDDFVTNTKMLLHHVKGPSKLNLILGDFNCDIFKPRNSRANQLLEIMFEHGLYNVIREATRVTPRSTTCIDLLFTNAQTVIVKSGVDKVGMSDHFMPFGVLAVSAVLKPPQTLPDSSRLQRLNIDNCTRHVNSNQTMQENDAQEASDLIDIDPDEKRRPPGGGGGGGAGGRMMGFEGLGGPPQAPGPGALYGASGGMGHPDQGFPQVPGSGVFPDTEPPPKAIPPYQPSGSLPARPPSYTDQGRGPQGQGPPYLPNHPPNAGCNRGLPPPVLPPGGASGGWQTHQNGGISGSDGAPLPTYTDVMYTPPAQQPNAPPGSSLGLPDLPDVPGLPSVPSSTLGMGSAGGEDVDFDDLTKRFEQLKKHK